jgi:[acyl-carrier-protein] S-malonyltransferase
MGKIAFVFPGQGSQRAGMGKTLYEGSAAARAVFELCEEIKPGLLKLCFEGTAEELSQTVNTQPCLYACEMAAAKAAEEAGIKCETAAGFSLGEVTAYGFSGGVSVADGFRLTCKRAELMQADAEKTAGTMVAVLKMDTLELESLCASFSHAYPVNYNAPGQISVAVAAEEVDAFREAVKAAGGKALPLKVSGGFHSPFMAEASDKFLAELSSFSLGDPKVTLYSNYTANPYEAGGDEVKNLLSKQIANPVRWEALVHNMAASGVDRYLEVGPGNVLSGLIRKILPDAQTANINEYDDIKGVAWHE